MFAGRFVNIVRNNMRVDMYARSNIFVNMFVETIGPKMAPSRQKLRTAYKYEKLSNKYVDKQTYVF